MNTLDVLPMLESIHHVRHSSYLIASNSWDWLGIPRQMPDIESQILDRLDHCPLFQEHPYFVFLGSGYKGYGAFPVAYDMSIEIDIEAMYHEIGHAFELYESKGEAKAIKRFAAGQWDLKIKSSIEIGGRHYEEPMSFQSSEREARVMGLQLRLMEMNGLPYDGKSFEVLMEEQALVVSKTLLKFMPDYVLNPKFKPGDSTSKEISDSQRFIARQVIESYHNWPPEKVLEVWKVLAPSLFKLGLDRRNELKQEFANKDRVPEAPKPLTPKFNMG